MHFRNVALALLSGCSTATAFVETDTSDFASFEYIDEELRQVGEWDIVEQPSVNITGLTDGGDKIATSSTTYVDSRSGKPAIIIPEGDDAILLPGAGASNRLLWTVGTSHDEGYGPLTDHRKLSEAAVEASRQWITDHQDELGVKVEELFASGTVRTETHSDGDVQISLQRTYQGFEVVGSRVAINIVAGNIVTFAVEQWGDINADFDVTPTTTADDAMDALSTHTGYPLLVGEETCDSEVQILTLTNDTTADESTVSLRGTTTRSLQTERGGYKHLLVWKVCPMFEGQNDAELFHGYVDAHTKKIMEFTNTVDMLAAQGGTYPQSSDGKIPGGFELPGL